MATILAPNGEILAEVKRAYPQMDEVGASGTTYFSGQLTEAEYNKDLQGQKGRDIYDRMRRSDGQVKAVLSACELPLRAATWIVQPASDEPQDEEIADFISNELFGGMPQTWDLFLKHVLLMLPFGFMMFEKVFEVVDNQVRWAKLAPRLPKTLYQWNFSNDGTFTGITQFVWKGNSFEFPVIPVERLLVFTNDREGDNYEGTSILRAAYKHWYYKDNLYRIDGIAAERHATGVPLFKHPTDAKNDDKARLDQIGEHLYANEKAYVRLAEGYEFDIKGLSGSIRDIMPSIEHHDRMIARSILADFLNLGSSDVGSWALSKDKSSFFLMSLRSVGRNICDTMNTAIRQLVDYNWSPEAYPELMLSNLEIREAVAYAKAITDSIMAGGVTPGDDVEAVLRNMLYLPAKAMEKQSEVHRYTKQMVERQLTEAETCVNFREINTRLNSAQKQFVLASRGVMGRQIDNLVDAASKIIDARDPMRLADLEVRYKSQMADAVYSVLNDMFTYGRSQVRKELVTQKVLQLAEPWPEPLGPADVTLVKEFLKARSVANAATMALQLKNYMTFEALRQIKLGKLDRAGLLTGLLSLSTKVLEKAAGYSVNEAFNYGRSVEAEKLSDQWDRAQYSAILDENACDVCRPLDGMEWPMDAEEVDKYASGNSECLGGGRCRCMLIYIGKAEVRAVK